MGITFSGSYNATFTASSLVNLSHGRMNWALWEFRLSVELILTECAREDGWRWGVEEEGWIERDGKVREEAVEEEEELAGSGVGCRVGVNAGVPR